MEFSQVKGDTWVLEAQELIPVYRLDARCCILLDTGLSSERCELEEALERCGLLPMGVFASHAHRDHMGNAFWLRGRYGARLSLPEGEAALCLSPALYRGSYDTFTPRQLLAYYGDLIGRVDEAVGPEDGRVEFCGVPFTVLHTPGHCPDQICTATPDGVLYTADALLAGDVLKGAKLPYHYTHEAARSSMEKLRGLPYGTYIVAHRAVAGALDGLIDENLALLDAHAKALTELADQPMTGDELLAAALRYWKALTTKEEKAARFDRNVRTLMEYLVDAGALKVTVRDGLRYYRRAGAPE